jgi:hypothetical protein
LRLDYGEWLRRRRRIDEAKPVLAMTVGDASSLGRSAVDPARRTGAARLRCHRDGCPDGTDALAGLAAQQRKIVMLASEGLTNAEIADRLFLPPGLSPRAGTAPYPKLGVAARHQLRGLSASPSP